MNSYSVIVVERDASNHTVLIIENVWIEGVLIESDNGNIGDRITVRAVSIREIPGFDPRRQNTAADPLPEEERLIYGRNRQ